MYECYICMNAFHEILFMSKTHLTSTHNTSSSSIIGQPEVESFAQSHILNVVGGIHTPSTKYTNVAFIKLLIFALIVRSGTCFYYCWRQHSNALVAAAQMTRFTVLLMMANGLCMLLVLLCRTKLLLLF